MSMKRLTVAFFMFLAPGWQAAAAPAPAPQAAAASTAEAAAAPAAETPAPPSVAILGALDKITAKMTRIEVHQDKPYKFGTLEIVLRTCHANPPEETPEAAAFLEISEDRNGQAPVRLFTGWMFASSPSLSALDHPVYDVWVVSCKISAADGASPSK